VVPVATRRLFGRWRNRLFNEKPDEETRLRWQH
jgi:hypothetical protein